jgi:hypothetical protein
MADNTVFYSSINDSVIQELNWRKQAGFSRSTAELDWTVSKTSWANVRITKNDGTTIDALNYRGLTGDSVSKDYLPAGYLSTTSYRTPPVLQIVDIQFADSSGGIPGLLNDAQLQIIVPDIEYFNNTFEKNWLRPGVNIRIEFGHSVRIGEDGNRGLFTGKIVSFGFDIQEDATVAVSIQAKATTELYTEIPAAKTVEMVQEIPAGSGANAQDREIVGIARKWFNILLPYADAGSAYYLNQTEITDPFIETDIKSIGIALPESEVIATTNLYRYITALQFNGKYIQYISLGLLVELLNQFIVSKWNNTPQQRPFLTVSSILSKSGYLENIVSTDPSRIILPGQDNYYQLGVVSNDANQQSIITPYDEWIQNLKENKESSTRDLKFYNEENGTKVGYPASILISIDAIQEIFDRLLSIEQQKKTREEREAVTISITKLINNVSNLIYTCTGKAIDLQLTRHPDVNSTDSAIATAAESILILRDANYVDTTKNTKPYVFPLFTNTKRGSNYYNAGSLIRNFKISGRIPDSLKQVALVFSQDSEDRLQGFLNYQYAEPEEKEQIKADLDKRYNSAKEALQQSITEFNNAVNETTEKDLNIKLLQYVATPRISDTSFPPPLWPLTIDFEMDGIYGLRFGDVLQFEPLPTAYQQNAVFIIYKIQHIIADNDWKTKITCLMRTKLQ